MTLIKFFSGKRMIHLSMLTFVLVSSTGLTFVNKKIISIPQPPQVRSFNVSKIPTLKEANSFPIVSAQGAIAVDLDSAVILYEKNANAPLLPASTTKIVTALVAMDYYPMNEVLVVGNVKVEGQKMGLFEGERITVENLLYGLLVYSGNDAAEVLAENYPGGRDMFVTAMNLKAKELNMINSHFENPTGLDAEGHVSTARDMVRLSQIAMKNPTFAKIVGTREIEVANVEGNIVYKLKNINELLGKVDGVKGVKTGWTENARENLVTYIERDGKKVMVAVLGSQDRFGETEELITWIFANYTWNRVALSE